MKGRFVRLDEKERPKISFFIDDKPASALQGDTLMVAILSSKPSLRESDFGEERRSGFCLMGACQDCWVWTKDGQKLRACTTLVSEGLNISTKLPEVTWPNLA